MEMYHITPTVNVANILKHGLLTRMSKENCVFLRNHPDPFSINGRRMDHDSTTILHVDVSGLKISRLDDTIFASYEDITADRIGVYGSRSKRRCENDGNALKKALERIAISELSLDHKTYFELCLYMKEIARNALKNGDGDCE